jgi:hypothetical protein
MATRDVISGRRTCAMLSLVSGRGGCHLGPSSITP